MSRWVIACLVPALLGVVSLSFLDGKREDLESELKVLRSSGDRFSDGRPKRTRTFRKPKSSAEESSFPPTVLEEIESLPNVSREELKSLVSKVLTVKQGEEFDWQAAKYRAMLFSMIELEPDWILYQLEKREPGVEYSWRSRTNSIRAFEVFLRKDREAALEWYVQGVNERSEHHFAKFGLCRLAAGELFKTDPGLAVELAGEDSRNFPRFGRLENFEQVSKCENLLPRLKMPQMRSMLKSYVASETYRLGGVEALRRLMGSRNGFNEGGKNRLDFLDRIGWDFASESGIKDLKILTQDAPEEIRAEIIGHHLGLWAYEDSVFAEKYISSMPPGMTKQIALERLAGSKSEYDPKAAILLLPQIENEQARDQIRKRVEKKWGESWVK